jgi:hypothetical protein
MKQLTKAEIVGILLMTDYGKVEGRVKLNSMRVDVLRSTAQRLMTDHRKVKGWEGAPKDYSKYYGREVSSFQRCGDSIT